MQHKLQQLQQQLAQGFIGRKSEIQVTLLGLLAGENTLLIGPPGTGKSMLARRISQAIKQDKQQSNSPYFEYLLTKFSTPEEIFGPLSISELKQDRFKRNTEGYLPTVQIGFLDEIFKASSSILNALLTILNERKYHNGTQSLDVPLLSLIAASNELPTGQDELSALYDRFLIRRFVDYLPENQLANLFDLAQSTQIDAQHQLTQAEIKQLQQDAEQVEFPADVQQAILQIWQQHKEQFKENSDEQLSDRRFVKILHLLRISAISNGRKQVDFSDVFLLKDCLWNNADNAQTVLDLVQNVIKQYDKIITLDETHQQNQQPKANNPAPKSQPSNNVIKGYKGSGTQQDPILIENVHHLKGLERPEVGQQGYYFKQMADIDCSGIDENSWFKIKFKGHYDGQNHKIIYNNPDKALFEVANKSQLHNIVLKNLALAWESEDCTISNCHTDSVLLGKFDGVDETVNAKQSKIIACSAGYYIAWNIHSSDIEYCQAYAGLIRFNAIKSKISNCCVLIQNPVFNSSSYREIGGIAHYLQKSSVQQCYVAGHIQYRNKEKPMKFYGISYIGDKNSSIANCALGQMSQEPNSNNYLKVLKNRISSRETHPTTQQNINNKIKSIVFNDVTNNINTKQNIKLSNNASIDSNNKANGWSISNISAKGQDGANISPAFFNQEYFEHSLGWDFNTVWEWNATENRPQLRLNLALKQDLRNANTSLLGKNQTTLLHSQMQANIWL